MILKFRNLVVLCIFLIGSGAVKAQNEQASSWFKVSQINDKTWCITDNGIVNMYLLEGKKEALLIDNGYGVANLRDLVNSLTKLPVKVVLTHGHWDHSGASFEFPLVYVNSKDIGAVRFANQADTHRKKAKDVLKNTVLTGNEIFKDTLDLKAPKLKPIKDGQVFDLGERKIKAYEMPGHTPGSVVFLDITNKILFSGDHINCPVWLFLDGCLPLETYLKNLEKIKTHSSEFTMIYPGHNQPLDPEFLDELITACKSILDGTGKSEKYGSSYGDALHCDYKRAVVCYKKDNLFSKK